jgi:hypothetical protein
MGLLGALATAALLAAAGDGSPLEPTDELTDAQLVDVMAQAIQDEYHAEYIYLRVTADHGAVLPFQNILHAEDRHSSAIGRLFANRGLDVPLSLWDLNNVPRFESIPAACTAAVQAEIDNIALYDTLLLNDLPVDVQRVFTSNRAASLERHLPAFQNCS